MTSFDLVRIREVWKRLFGMDVEKKRRDAGLPSVAGHLQQLEKLNSETPFADRLLAEIDATEKTAKSKPKKWRRLPPKPESKEPGIRTGDVIRVFGSECGTILTQADWQEVPEADQRAILEEAARWFYEKGPFPGDGQWRRANVTAGRDRANSISSGMK